MDTTNTWSYLVLCEPQQQECEPFSVKRKHFCAYYLGYSGRLVIKTADNQNKNNSNKQSDTQVTTEQYMNMVKESIDCNDTYPIVSV